MKFRSIDLQIEIYKYNLYVEIHFITFSDYLLIF